MKRKLQTKTGRAIYSARKGIVEPVFGQIKHCRGFRQFLLRELDKVRAEWALVYLTHNIIKDASHLLWIKTMELCRYGNEKSKLFKIIAFDKAKNSSKL
jgi:hypothetical protein